MNDMFAEHGSAGFGPCCLTGDSPPVYMVTGARSSALKVRVRQEAPRRPGVYGMWDENAEIIYIGKARCLRTRLLSYFRTRSRDPKAGRIVRPARAIGWETVPDEFGSLLRELELIRRWQPRFNVQGQPRRRRLTYVCVGRSPAPYVFLSARPGRNLLSCHGPVPQTQWASEAVRRINEWHRLRDCPQSQVMHFADEEELFPQVRVAGCPRHELETCLGPCAAACTQEQYAERVKGALSFLQGGDSPLLAALEARMTAASVALDFELAARLRDQSACLKWLLGQLERLRMASERYSFIYPVRGHNHHDRWYLVKGGRVVRVLPWPRGEEPRKDAARIIDEVYRKKSLPALAPMMEELEGVYLVAKWFRRRPEQMKRVLSPTIIAKPPTH